MSEYKYTKKNVIQELKDALSFVEQGQYHSYDSPWKKNDTVQKYLDDAAEELENTIDNLEYELEYGEEE
jgi:ribosome recycling factor